MHDDAIAPLDALLDVEDVPRADGARGQRRELHAARRVEDDAAVRPAARRTAASSPLGTLSGSDNLVEVYTQWYNDNPLVLRGAGAGTGATAAGVLADMLDLAYTAA